jgi:glycosyltransferase involved in cell wall biosynthesis
LKIGILGTRGIPNYHGGFEQFAEFFSVFLKEKGHDVYVYSSGNHPYQKDEFKGVKLIHCKDPENKVGTVGQFIYDLNCIRNSRKMDFDILLQLGYTSNSVWHRWLPKNPIIITNMDGLEWKRTKYSTKVRRFLKYAESLAVKSSDFLVADSKGIQDYLKETYNVSSKYIAYGSFLFSNPIAGILSNYNVTPYDYNMLIARLEPENSIETILDGVVRSKSNIPFLVVGKHDTNKFGAYLKDKYKDHTNIRLIGGIYNQEHLNNLRYYSKIYFHGHTVGGTNPSLLEAMASDSLVVAHDNQFNKAILNNDAFYFHDAKEVTAILKNITKKEDHRHFLDNNREKIENIYSWDIINNAYLVFMEQTYEQNR